MGFNKRFLSESMIKERLSNGQSYDKIFNADALIFTDDYSYNLYENFKHQKLNGVQS